MHKLNKIISCSIFLLVSLIFNSLVVFSQGGAAINSSGNSADASAGLDIQFNDKGLLIPRMTTAERDNNILNPADGLLIYNTSTQCLEVFAYNVWQALGCANCPFPSSAGSISGSASVCQGQSLVSYTVPIINNAATYIWAYTGSGVTINGTTNNITLDFAANATSGNLTVKGNNQCGDGVSSPAFQINVNSIPSNPSSGSHIAGQTQIEWLWNAVQGATAYKYNTVNNYGTAVDVGSNTSYTQMSLSCGSSYTLYVWAYNTCGNSVVTSLNQSTSACAPAFVCGSTFTDPRDNKTYNTVLIGSQCWMKENLNYDQSAHGQDWCYQNDPSYCTTSGRLYDWTAAMQGAQASAAVPSGVQGVCPQGWHIPSNAEMDILANLYGGYTNAGCALKAISPLWQSNYCSTNASGWTGLPGGRNGLANFMNYYLGWFQITHCAYHWTATEDPSIPAQAYQRELYFGGTQWGAHSWPKMDGHSVRCVLD